MLNSQIILCLLITILLQSWRMVFADVVLLRNGGVLEGEVIEFREHYVVQFSKGNEIQILRHSVDIVCDSMNDAYQRKRERNSRDDADLHIELAQWCVQHDLLEQAKIELGAVKQSRRKDIRIAILLRKIQMSKRAMLARDTATEIAIERSKDKISLEPPDTRVMNSLSPAATAAFRSRVEPRLLNGCATSGCHNTASDSSFKLVCDAPSRPVTRWMTIENLNASYKLIDTNNPEQSSLLKYVTLVHGEMRGPVWRSGSENYQQIRAWIYSVANAQHTDGVQSSQVAPAGFLQEHNWSAKVSAEDADLAPSNSQSQPEKSNHVDPFDPEVFNRRFGVDRPSPKKSATSQIELPSAEFPRESSPITPPAFSRPR